MLDATGVSRPIEAPRLAQDDTLDFSDHGTIQIVEGSNAPWTTTNNRAYQVTAFTETDLIAQTTETAAQLLIHIKGDTAPTEYAFDFPGRRLSLDETGGVLVSTAEGTVVGGITPPWATDSTGTAVPTRYQIRGSHLIQVVDHRGFSHPVVADPSYSACMSRVVFPAFCIKYKRADIERMYAAYLISAASSAAAGAELGCGLIPNPAGKAACKAVIAGNVSKLSLTMTRAYRNKTCVMLKIPMPAVAQIIIDISEVKC